MYIHSGIKTAFFENHEEREEEEREEKTETAPLAFCKKACFRDSQSAGLDSESSHPKFAIWHRQAGVLAARSREVGRNYLGALS